LTDTITLTLCVVIQRKNQLLINCDILTFRYDEVGEEILILHVDKRGWLYKHAQNAGNVDFEFNILSLSLSLSLLLSIA
jgi:hypothetical protein